MLFNSAVFIFAFLPLTLAGFFVLGMNGRHRAAVVWLCLASLVFYSWWSIANLPILLVSITVNFLIGRAISRHRAKALLVVGIAFNLVLLGYYKYAGFLVGSIEAALELGLPVPQIVLPLAISFFTFQQIAYLCDIYDGLAEDGSFANYVAFITFFPHLIAGPITHHKEMMPQFDQPQILRPQTTMLAVGLTMFLLGLFKKVMIADSVSVYVGPVFDAAGQGQALTLFEAWGGALAYTLQIYFDFSGYSDMAIGLGLMFGIRLPFNFDSPLKAASIIDYWARWHMTLTRFVTAYIYNPIAMQRSRRRMEAGKSMPKRGKMSLGAFVSLVAWPTMVAFIIIGVWHGAGWQFAAFGLLHGIYLTINHGWRALAKVRGWPNRHDSPLFVVPNMLLTLGCVVVGLVFFRAPDLATALQLIEAMAGVNGVELKTTEFLNKSQVAFIALLFAVVWILPNTQEWLRKYPTGLGTVRAPGWFERKLGALGPVSTWQPSGAVAVLVGLLGFLAITRAISAAPPEFIYFNF
jgi:D-alanyl-lipoteichoic acid acyltransferase DltB (MBOAT superfamily)